MPSTIVRRGELSRMITPIKKEGLILTIVILLATISPWNSQAQEFGRVNDYENNGGAYHSFYELGEATVQIQVLGSIGVTGLWEVGISIDLGQLIALAGGPTATLNQETQGSTRSYSDGTVKLYRRAGGRRDLIYEAEIDRMLMEPEHYPPLQDGDVLVVETVTYRQNRLTWRDAFLILNTVISTAVLIDNLRN